MAYSIQLLYTSVPALIALKQSMFLSLCSEASTTIIIRRGVENLRLEAEAKDSPSENRPFQGQGQGQPFGGQTLSRPRPRTKDTGASVLQKKKKRSSKKNFQAISKKGLQTNFSSELQKKVFKRFFQGIYKILTVQLIVLSSSRGKGNF